MSNTIEYILSLNDLMSGKLQKIGITSDTALTAFSKLEIQSAGVNKIMTDMGKSVSSLEQKLSLLKNERDIIPASNLTDIKAYNAEIKKTEVEITKLRNASEKGGGGSLLGKMKSGAGEMLGAMGFGFGAFQLMNIAEKGIEKAHALHESEAQLANTMKNMGNYSAEGFEKVVEGSKKLASHIDYSSADIIGLQSQLRLVGNIGESEMQKLVMASADMSTKFGMGITEAGNMLAKAVNNPEMMRRLGMQMKIDPKVVEHIQDLAKHGKETAARLELIDAVQRKIGGSAQAAFDANPANKFKKAIGSIYTSVGEALIAVSELIAPVITATAFLVKIVFGSLATGIKWFFDGIKEGNPYVEGLLILMGGLATAFLIYEVYTKRAVIWKAILTGLDIIATGTTSLFTSAIWAQNAAWLANPVGLIIVGISVLIGAIVICYQKFETFRGVIYASWEALKGLGQIFNDITFGVIGSFLSGLGGLGKALWQFVSGDWKKAWQTAKDAAKDLTLMNTTQKVMDDAHAIGKNIAGAYNKGVADFKKDELADKKKKEAGLAPFGGIPGMEGSEGMPTAGSGENPTQTKTETVASGGTRNTQVTINIGKVIETISFKGDLKDNYNDFKNRVQEAVMQVLYMAETVS